MGSRDLFAWMIESMTAKALSMPRVNLCAKLGAAGGISVGVLLTAYGLATLGETFEQTDAVWATGLGIVYAFLILAYLFFVIGRGSVLGNLAFLLFNAAVVTALTVGFAYLTQLLFLAWLAGTILGYSAGLLLCHLHKLISGN